MNVEDQLKQIAEVVYKNKETTERLEANWDNDRHDFSEFQNRLGHLEAEFKSLREAIQKLPQKTGDKVTEAIQPIMDTTDALTTSIEKKKMIFNQGKKSWWGFWKK